MTPKRKRRMAFAAALVLGVGAAAALALTAFRENLVYFHSPTEVVRGEAPLARRFRLGGLVEAGSLERAPDSLEVRFVVTDTAERVTVRYDGVLPDLFREGQGIVADGRLSGEGVFVAERVLAKHDENYMPPEAAQALHEAGATYAPAAEDYAGGRP